MTVGDKQYNEADLLRMQRDAEERVRDMQHRARQTVDETNQNSNGNWSSYSGMRRRPSPGRPLHGQPGRQYNGQPTPQGQRRQYQQAPEPPHPPAPNPSPYNNNPPEPPPHNVDPPASSGEKKEGTIIGDIMGALGLDEDYLLIIGLILILINQRSDTTLILALAYLLI